jgi:hypothetical protein
MGYYTSYKLKELTGQDHLVGEFVREDGDKGYQAYALHEDGESGESCKWYDHEDFLKKFSLKHPKALFELSGEGEESGDVWKKYSQNGKVQTCKAVITFPEFDKKKLK